MAIELKRINSDFLLEAGDGHAHKVLLDASSKIGGGEEGFRPMDLLLTSLAGCSAIDVISILRKQKQDVTDFSVEISGIRKDAIPATFEHITLTFFVNGNVAEAKLQRAIELSRDTYCSVRHSLDPAITVDYDYRLNANA